MALIDARREPDRSGHSPTHVEPIAAAFVSLLLAACGDDGDPVARDEPSGSVETTEPTLVSFVEL